MKRKLLTLHTLVLICVLGATGQQQPPEKKTGPEVCEYHIFFQKTSWEDKTATQVGAFFEEELRWWELQKDNFARFCRVSDVKSADLFVNWSTFEVQERRAVATGHDASRGLDPRIPPGAPGPPPVQAPAQSRTPGIGELYTVRRARVQVFSIKEGVIVGKPLFQRDSRQEKKLGEMDIPLRVMANTLFELALKGLEKKLPHLRK